MRRQRRLKRLLLVATSFAVFGLSAVSIGGTGRASAAPPVKVKVCASGCDFATIQAALSAVSDGATIIIAPGTYTGFSVPSTLEDVTLLGAGSSQTIFDGGVPPYYRYVVENAGTATISGVTITGGISTSPYSGGGLSNWGTLTLKNSVVMDNTGSHGGGIVNDGTLTLASSTVTHNTATLSGGGIYNVTPGNVTLSNSVVSDNESPSGGGIYSLTADVTLSNSVVSDNDAYDSSGGGIAISTGGTLTVKDTTISGNTASDTRPWGGGIFAQSGTVLLSHTIVTGNTAGVGGGIWNGDWYGQGAADLTLNTSTIQCNTPDDIFGTYYTESHSIIGGCTS